VLRRRDFVRAIGSTPVALATFARASGETDGSADPDTVTGDTEELWGFQTGGDIRSSPTVVGGEVYVGSDSGYVYSVSSSDGSESWGFETDDGVVSSPAVEDGTVYFGSKDGSLYALDASDGTEVWSHETGYRIISSPALSDGRVYVGNQGSELYALDTSDGSELWRYEVENPVYTPVVSDGKVYFRSGSHLRNREGGVGTHTVTESEGEKVWDTEVGSRPFGTVTVSADGGTVYTGGEEGLYALDASDGSVEWRFDTDGRVNNTPTVSEGSVYFTSMDGGLYAVSSSDGDIDWRFSVGTPAPYVKYSSPTVADGVVYIGSYSGTVYGLDPSAGETTEFEAGGAVMSSPTVVDGVLYVGSDDGRLYALDVGVSGSSDGSRVALGTFGHHTETGFDDRPTEISTVEELQAIEDNLSEDYILVEDIDASGFDFEPVGKPAPLGRPERVEAFNGTLYGDGRVITGLEIEDGAGESNSAGLFATVGSEGSVEEVTVEDATVEVSEGRGVGVLAGVSNGEIKDSRATGSVEGKRQVGGLVGEAASGGVYASGAEVRVRSEPSSESGFDVGGLVGYLRSEAEVLRSYATGDVTGGSRVGGLSGLVFGKVSGSYSAGDVAVSRDASQAGGLVGGLGEGGVVESSYATGSVTGDERVGGLVGRQSSLDSESRVARSYAAGKVTGDSEVGGLVGSLSAGDGTAEVRESYWDIGATGERGAIGASESDIPGEAVVGAETQGLDTGEMRGDTASEAMGALDFSDTWDKVTEPDGYPVLSWQDGKAVKSSEDEGGEGETEGKEVDGHDQTEGDSTGTGSGSAGTKEGTSSGEMNDEDEKEESGSGNALVGVAILASVAVTLGSSVLLRRRSDEEEGE